MHPLHISTSFDAGAIEVVSLVDPQDIQLKIRADNASDFAQWFYFCLQGAAGVPVRLNFVNAGQSAYPKGWINYRVVASYDHQNWFRLDTDFDDQVLSTSFTPAGNSVYLAYFEPYSYERHLDLIGSAANSEHVALERLGSSLDGRDMTLLQVTNAQSPVPLAQRKKIWLIARQHPGESMAEWFVEGFLERLLDEADPVSRVLLDQCVFYVVPNMNPDGAVRGNLRTNAAGANLNREWATPSLDSSPEVYWVRQKMLEVGVDLNLDAHGDEGLPYNFVVGTDDTPGYSPRIAALEEAFKASWLAVSPDFQTEHGYPRGKHGEANMTLATNWIGQQFGCLAFTIEMPFKDNANLPDPQVGWNGERSKRLGASVLQPVLAVLNQLRA
ncbi:M14-type cytosolic carboxypeptidase [Rhodoferax sp. U11-2br]|uniref:M14 family metallopeptidase n=1 Tax=Rhodoferax sp. U11-2br TaxID=2838878 RepID=UPI001BE6E008|nr:M14-type cytosolic carboxypeptidase [Rhodoferax sp. U11-2br]MBT3067002.1 carboxypeptidase family protein [Rhodoferax sp. U11-2br]